MIADRVTGLRHLLYKVWAPSRSLADHEKGCLCFISRQHLDEPGGEFRVRAIVKGQGDDCIRC